MEAELRWRRFATIMNRREPSSAGGPVLLLLLCSLSLLAGSAWFVSYRQFASERRVTNRPIQIESYGYASSNACQSCHPAEYASWHDSYHRTMTQLATSQTVIP